MEPTDIVLLRVFAHDHCIYVTAPVKVERIARPGHLRALFRGCRNFYFWNPVLLFFLIGWLDSGDELF